jgi:hypothetical protein
MLDSKQPMSERERELIVFGVVFFRAKTETMELKVT